VYKEDRKIDDNESSDNKRKRTSDKTQMNDDNASDSIEDSSSISAPDDGIKDNGAFDDEIIVVVGMTRKLRTMVPQ
jgi:hypothetical protein